MQCHIAFAASHQDQIRTWRLRDGLQQHVEALVVAQPANREQTQAGAGPLYHCGIYYICSIAGVGGQPERDHPCLFAPRRQGNTGITIQRGSGNDGACALQQRLFPRPVKTVRHAQTIAAGVQGYVGMPMHQPWQAPRGR